MKKIPKLFYVICMCVVSITQTKAQEELDCNFNMREAVFYLKGDDNFKRDTLKSINYLKPCIEKGNITAKIILSRIYASQKNKQNNKKAFKILKEIVKENNPIAIADLATLYKYGIGCKLNFNKARKWYKVAADLGNDKAAYSLGYLFLKGYGDIDQNYKKAIKWFEKSEYPMAKYWLGVCYYYGYGVSKDIAKANELLGTNFTDNVSENQNTNSTDENDTNNISEELDLNTEDSVKFLEVNEENLYGKWTGKLLKFDWSGKKIEYKHNFEIEIKYDSINEVPVYQLKLNENEFSERKLELFDSSLYFEDLQINLPHNSFSEKIPSNLNYSILSSNLTIKNIGEYTFLTGEIESHIDIWNEPGSPLRFVLKKKEVFSNSNEEISDEILSALSEQEENFIKLYPNPFETDLIISYTLDVASFVEVRVTDVNAYKNDIVEKGVQQKAGNYRYYFNGSNLDKGIYLVTVVVNDQKKTRIIVKK